MSCEYHVVYIRVALRCISFDRKSSKTELEIFSYVISVVLYLKWLHFNEDLF